MMPVGDAGDEHRWGEFDEMVARHLDGALDERGFERFQIALRESGRSRRRFVEQCQFAQASAEIAGALALPEAAVETVAPVPGGSSPAWWRRYSAPAAAAVAAAIVLLFAYADFKEGGFGTPRPVSSTPAIDTPAKPDGAPARPRVTWIALIDRRPPVRFQLSPVARAGFEWWITDLPPAPPSPAENDWLDEIAFHSVEKPLTALEDIKL